METPLNTNQIPNPLPPIAQIAYNITEVVIQDVIKEEITEEVTDLLAQHNMLGKNGFLRAVVAKNVVNAYLAIPQKKAEQVNGVRPPRTDNSLFSVTKEDNNEELKIKTPTPLDNDIDK